MTTIQPLTFDAHAMLRIDTRASAAFGDAVGVVGVVPAEFPSLLSAYPLLLRKNSRTGQFEPCALLGFAADENLFLGEDGWDVAYVPLQRQVQPFTLAPGAQAGAPPVLAIDIDSPRIAPAGTEIVWRETGEPSAYLTRISAMIETLRSGSRIAHAYAAELERLRLIEPVRIELAFIDGSETSLEGLYAIDAPALRALSGAALGAMQAAGYLELAWYQVGSLVHMQALIARKNKRLLAGAR